MFKLCNSKQLRRRDFLFVCAQPSDLEWKGAERRRNAAFQSLWDFEGGLHQSKLPMPWLILKSAISVRIDIDDEEEKDEGKEEKRRIHNGLLAYSTPSFKSINTADSLGGRDRNRALTALVGLGIARRSAPELLLAILLLLNVAFVEGDIWECHIDKVMATVLELETKVAVQRRRKRLEPHDAEGGPHSKADEDDDNSLPASNKPSKKANLDDPMARETAREKLKGKMQWNKKQRKSIMGKKKVKSSIVRMKTPGKAIGECLFICLDLSLYDRCLSINFYTHVAAGLLAYW